MEGYSQIISQRKEALPLRRIAFWGFILNAIWEFTQCIFLYDMWQWGFWRGALWMWAAIFGDVLIVLGIVKISSLLSGPSRLNPPDGGGWLALISTSFIASILLEWVALYLELWEYNTWMPTLEIFGFKVGLSPIFQISLLPALSVLLALRYPNKTVNNNQQRSHTNQP